MPGMRPRAKGSGGRDRGGSCRPRPRRADHSQPCSPRSRLRPPLRRRSCHACQTASPRAALLSVAGDVHHRPGQPEPHDHGQARPGDCEGLGARNGLRRRRRGSQEQIVRRQHRAELRSIEALPRLAMIGRPAQRFSFLSPSRFFLAIRALGAYINIATLSGGGDEARVPEWRLRSMLQHTK